MATLVKEQAAGLPAPARSSSTWARRCARPGASRSWRSWAAPRSRTRSRCSRTCSGRSTRSRRRRDGLHVPLGAGGGRRAGAWSRRTSSTLARQILERARRPEGRRAPAGRPRLRRREPKATRPQRRVVNDRAIPDGPAWASTSARRRSTRTGSASCGAKTVFWNGPMGLFEQKPWAEGTFGVARAMAESAGRHRGRRRRQRRGGRGGRARRQDEARLHRRRREPRVPRGPRAPRRQGPGGVKRWRVRKFVCGNWKMHKTVAEARGLVRELAAGLGERCRQGAGGGGAALHRARTRWRQALRGTPIEVSRPERATGRPRARSPARSRRRCWPRSAAARDRRPQRAAAALRRDRRGACSKKTARCSEAGPHAHRLRRRDAGRARGRTHPRGRGPAGARRRWPGLAAEQLGELTIAYEPVWAIGTGKTATTAQAQEVHAAIREHPPGAGGRGGRRDAHPVRRLREAGQRRGSSLAQPDVDGALVGGASLKARGLPRHRERRTPLITLVTVIHVVVCVFLILVILLQAGKGGGMGAGLRRRLADRLRRPRRADASSAGSPASRAAIFMLTSVWLAYHSSRTALGGRGRRRPAPAPAAPAPAGPAPGGAAPADGRDAARPAAVAEVRAGLPEMTEKGTRLPGSPFAVPRARFELARLTAPPPQDGVSTSSTTWAKRTGF